MENAPRRICGAPYDCTRVPQFTAELEAPQACVARPSVFASLVESPGITTEAIRQPARVLMHCLEGKRLLVQLTPSYSAGLADVTALGPGMISALGQADFRTAAVQAGVSALQFDRLADEIAIWAVSEDSIAAFAECTVIGWKP